jgi:hypothetical protein
METIEAIDVQQAIRERDFGKLRDVLAGKRRAVAGELRLWCENHALIMPQRRMGESNPTR